MIKMFASDLDGTLLNALHEADDERQHESEVSEFWYHETFSVSLLPVLLN